MVVVAVDVKEILVEYRRILAGSGSVIAEFDQG